MTAVLADTHAIVWWLTDEDTQLSEPALEALSAADEGGGIFVSAVTLLDVWYATHKRRDPVTRDQLEALDQALSDPEVNVHVLPVTADDARAAWEPARDVLRDPFDRIIVATARTRGLPLITADGGLRSLALVEAIW